MDEVAQLRDSGEGNTSPDDAATAPVGAPAPALAPPAPALHEGSIVGRFVVIEELGRGGMGQVLRAYDPKLQREVALKIVRSASSSNDSDRELRHGPSASDLRRLVAEARAMAKLSHPNVVAVYDVEELDRPPAASLRAPSREGPRLALVMELVDGRTLRAWLREEDRRWQEIVRCFIAAGRGVAAAHAAALLHRDFKPTNVLIATDGTVKVTDFGLAKRSNSMSAGGTADAIRTTSEDAVTEAGVVLGTPRYMAPEQHAGAPLSEAADQYAFCLALWEALCGDPPFCGKKMATYKHQGPPAWPNGAVPRRIADAIVRGLAPDPARRWPCMDDLLAALEYDPATRRSRVLLGVGSAALAAVAIAGGQAWVSSRVALCSGARDQLTASWGDTRRTEVEEAFVALDVPYAATAWTHAARTLDDYAAHWISAYTETCEATAVRGEQSEAVMDLRMVCLSRARYGIEAVADELARVDASTIGRAHKVTEALPELERCTDVDALLEAVEPPSLDEAEAVDEIRRTLARATAARRAGRYDHAKTIAEEAQSQAAGTSYGPVQAEAALELGNILDDVGEYDAAETVLQDALRLAARWDLKVEMHRAATALMYVVGYEQSKEEGLRYYPLAQGLAGDDPELVGMTHNRMASILFAQGDYAAAEQEFRSALASWERARGSEHGSVASVLNNLALALHGQGKYDEAEVEHRRALAIEERILGELHPEIASSRNNLGNALYSQKKYAEAEREYRRGLSIARSTLGKDHPEVAMAVNNVANVLYAREDYAEAETEYRRAIAIWEATLGAEHPNVAGSYDNLGIMLAAQGKLEDAEAAHRHSLALTEKMFGTEHPAVARSRNNLGMFLLETGDLDAAESELRTALALRQKLLGPEHPKTLTTRTNLEKLTSRRELGRASSRQPSLPP